MARRFITIFKKGKMIKDYVMGTTSNKNFNSAIICVVAVIAVILLDRLFPASVNADIKTAIITAIMAFIYNTIREVTKN